MDPVRVPPLDGINGDAVEKNGEVQVVAASQAGFAADSNHLPALHAVADLGQERDAGTLVERRAREARDAADARAKLAGLAFDALVLDVMMPGESGLDFTRWLRRVSTVPVLLLTAPLYRRLVVAR